MSTVTDTEVPRQPSPPPASRPPRKRRRRGSEWLLFAALLFAVMAPVSGLWDVIDGRRWFENATVTVAGMLAAGTIARVLGRSYAWVLAASAAGLVVMLTLQFLPTTALLGVVPTPETLRRALALYPQAQEAILSQAQPVLAEDPIVFFTCLAAGLTGLMVQIVVIGLRAPALAAIPLSVFLVTSSLVKTDGAGLLHVALTAAGFLLVLAAARLALRSTAPTAAVRTGVARQAAAIAAGALALMLLVPLAVPGFTQGLMPQGQRLYLFGKPSGVNPVLNLGVNLRDRLGLTTVTYYTDSPDPLYLRTAVISDLTADRWEPTDFTVARDPNTAVLAPTEREQVSGTLPDAARKRQVNTRIVTGNYLSPWLPMPRDAATTSGLSDAWGYYHETQTMFSPEQGASLDLDYTVTSAVPVIDAEALQASSEHLAESLGAIDLPPTYTDLPDDLPAIINDTARRITRAAGATTAYDEAVALQDELRSPDYTYSEQTPLQQGYDGNGIGVVEAFLQKKSGYCTHFSSAMALMARSLGIPSRIVVGYAPGRTNGSSVLGTDGKQWAGYELSARSAHAWPELFFPGLGWVPFEPTPGRGTTPSYASDSPTGGAAATPPSNDEPHRSTRPEAATPSEAASTPAAAGSQGTGNDDGGAGPGPQVALALVLVLAGLFGPLGWRRWAKARRLRRIHRPEDWQDGPRAAWAELLALGRDYGWAQRPSETDAGYGTRLSVHLPDAAPALDRVREAFERATYSRDTGPQRQLVPRGPATGIHRQRATRELPVDQALVAALTEIEQAFSDAATPGRQFLARAWPASLLRG